MIRLELPCLLELQRTFERLVNHVAAKTDRYLTLFFSRQKLCERQYSIGVPLTDQLEILDEGPEECDLVLISAS